MDNTAQGSPTAAPSASAALAAAENANPASFEGGSARRESTSGEVLLVEAYAFVWLAVLGFVMLAWRRTRALEDRLTTIERALERSPRAPIPSTKRSADDV
jgi:hypothetical protein